ncbi:hypothetical protein C2S51_009179, partial [Perilla frutescens var. frutescens]
AIEKGVTTAQVRWETFMKLHGNNDADYSDHKSASIAGKVCAAIEQIHLSYRMWTRYRSISMWWAWRRHASSDWVVELRSQTTLLGHS